MQNPPLWAEDLEGHRQPSLYYLCEEDGDVEGPTLICDWNGVPTNYEDFDTDIMSEITRNGTVDDTELLQGLKGAPELEDEDNEQINPTADLIKAPHDNGVSTQTSVINDFDLADCRHLDFLSVPPMTSGLLKYMVKQFRQLKEQKVSEPALPPAIKRETSKKEHSSEKK